MIVRKYTNYLHHIYKKAHPEILSASEIIKVNPLLKFSSTLSGRQLFAREIRPAILAAAKQQVADTGTTEAGAYRTTLKKMWDALNKDNKLDWEEKAEEELGDVALNQEEFRTNIHQALSGLCQGGIVGDAEMMLFYGFWDPETGDILAGTQVRNLSDCIKVAIDFVSVDNIECCEKLMQEFWGINDRGKPWKVDVLQLRSLLWFAWATCCHEEDRQDGGCPGIESL
ncbi:hypothetical protein B0H10DRAFT_2218332 [Mycena sp. CBHHK59/15]|nr:hypothetical protein B0H10DRAFT_2218332 [Mycena sp. CBHHK59/15]